MTIDLTKSADQVDITSPTYKAMLGNLQGNILKSHGRNASRHVFLRFTGTRAQARAWIKTKVAPKVLTAAEQQVQAAKKAADPNFDGGLVTLFHLSAAGYTFLGFKPKDKFRSEAFVDGMKDQKKGFFKEVIEQILSIDNKDPKPSLWEAGFRKEIHAMIAFADDLNDDNDDATLLLNAVSGLKAEIAGFAEILLIDEGRTLRRERLDLPPPDNFEPIEHFGYFDGISQPLFTQQDLKSYYDKKKGTKAPGAWDPSASLDLLLVPDPLTPTADAFGSYFVYRKLFQDLKAFEAGVKATATAVGLTDTLTGAMTVGRFKDGTPVVDFDKPTAHYTNDFDFKLLDDAGFKCPHHAHARKVNPRGTTPKPGLKTERRHRIARRGIPYGKPIPGLCGPEVPSDPNMSAPRGLLFMCFQANIEDQFGFIQRVWVDNPNFPTNVLNLPGKDDTGDDPLIGQDKNEKQNWPKKWNKPADGKVKVNLDAAVTLKGGEYFFAPSIPFLKSL